MNPQKNRKRKTDKGRSRHINKTVLLLVLFCLCVGGIALVSAKYIKQNVTKNNSAMASEFYFESDLLDGKEHEVVATEDNGKTAKVTLRLKNHVDELRYSETEIDYTISVVQKDGTKAEDVTIDQENGTIAAGKATNDRQTHDVDVTLSGLKAGETYTVTATTDNTYHKMLSGTIKVLLSDTKLYASISDKTQYIEVTVWTTDYAGEVKVTYGNIGLIPDNTDAKLKNAKSTGGTITESDWKENTSHVYRFFKSDVNKNYRVTVSNKEVTVSEES